MAILNQLPIAIDLVRRNLAGFARAIEASLPAARALGGMALGTAIGTAATFGGWQAAKFHSGDDPDEVENNEKWTYGQLARIKKFYERRRDTLEGQADSAEIGEFSGTLGGASDDISARNRAAQLASRRRSMQFELEQARLESITDQGERSRALRDARERRMIAEVADEAELARQNAEVADAAKAYAEIALAAARRKLAAAQSPLGVEPTADQARLQARLEKVISTMEPGAKAANDASIQGRRAYQDAMVSRELLPGRMEIADRAEKLASNSMGSIWNATVSMFEVMTCGRVQSGWPIDHAGGAGTRDFAATSG